MPQSLLALTYVPMSDVFYKIVVFSFLALHIFMYLLWFTNVRYAIGLVVFCAPMLMICKLDRFG